MDRYESIRRVRSSIRRNASSTSRSNRLPAGRRAERHMGETRGGHVGSRMPGLASNARATFAGNVRLTIRDQRDARSTLPDQPMIERSNGTAFGTAFGTEITSFNTEPPSHHDRTADTVYHALRAVGPGRGFSHASPPPLPPAAPRRRRPSCRRARHARSRRASQRPAALPAARAVRRP